MLVNTLRDYADPDAYFAITILPDRPAGWFADDVDEGHPGYDRPMPGRAARRAIELYGAAREAGRVTLESRPSPDAPGS
jgi:hypothetical protein